MRNQPPQLRWFVLTIQKGDKKTTRRLLAINREKAISQGNKILKYVPGSGPSAKVVDAKEET